MARGRMLNKSISESKKFDKLPDDTARLLATWTIAHLDKNGVFYADPIVVKSKIFPRRLDITIQQVSQYLQAMQDVGLIILFEAKDDVWQYWTGFHDEQVGLRPERENTKFPLPPTELPPTELLPDEQPPASSQLPEPSLLSPEIDSQPQQLLSPEIDSQPQQLLPPEIDSQPQQQPATIRQDAGSHPATIRQDAGSHPASCRPKLSLKLSLKESNNGDSQNNPPQEEKIEISSYQQISTCWESKIGFINHQTRDYLSDWLNDHSPEFIIEVINIAVKRANGKPIRSPLYIQNVLDTVIRERDGPSPAVKVYCKTARRSEPIPELAETITEVVGHDENDLEFWKQVIIGCAGRGWNVSNIQNLLDHFKRREIPANQAPGGNTNGKPKANQSTITGLYPSNNIQKRANLTTGETYYWDSKQKCKVAAPVA